MKNKDILFVIEIDTSLHDEAERCILTIKMGDLVESISIPMLSTERKEKIALESELSVRIFWFNMSFTGTHLTAEHYGTIYPLRQMHQYTRGICRYWGQINEPCKHQLFSHICIDEAVAAAAFNTVWYITCTTFSTLTSEQKLYNK